MSHFRYLTNCYTDLRHYHYYAKVSKPLYRLIYPCSKAAVIGLPFIIGPTAKPPVAPSVPPIEQSEAWGGTGEAWMPLGGIGLPWGGLPIEGPVASPVGEFARSLLGIGPVGLPETPVVVGPVAPPLDVPEVPSIGLLAVGVALTLAGRWGWR